jgi:hypothetical protein
MMMWMEEREQMWDARYEDDQVWGAGITNKIAKTMKGVAQGQQEREREREVTARMDSGGLEDSQHADRMREESTCRPRARPRPRPDGWIKHGRETPDTQKR